MGQSPDVAQSTRKRRATAGTKATVGAKEKRVRLTQKAIVSAAAELFARNGFGATSLDDIACVLGVTKTALYYHVKNKEEILRLICLSVLNVAEEPLRHIVKSDIPPIEKLQRAIEHHITISADCSPAVTVFYHEQPHLSGPLPKRLRSARKNTSTILSVSLRRGRPRRLSGRYYPKIASFGIMGMCHWLSQWYHPSGRYTPQQIAAMFNTMVGHGLFRSDVS